MMARDLVGWVVRWDASAEDAIIQKLYLHLFSWVTFDTSFLTSTKATDYLLRHSYFQQKIGKFYFFHFDSFDK